MEANKINVLTQIFIGFAILSLLFCLGIYQGVFNIPHVGLPLIVMFTSMPATLIFFVIWLISLVKLQGKKGREYDWYHMALIANIMINAVSSYPLLRYM